MENWYQHHQGALGIFSVTATLLSLIPQVFRLLAASPKSAAALRRAWVAARQARRQEYEDHPSQLVEAILASFSISFFWQGIGCYLSIKYIRHLVGTPSGPIVDTFIHLRIIETYAGAFGTALVIGSIMAFFWIWFYRARIRSND